jgi:hypothetical protein
MSKQEPSPAVSDRELLEKLIKTSEQLVYGSHGNSFLPGQMKAWKLAIDEAKERLERRDSPQVSGPTDDDWDWEKRMKLSPEDLERILKAPTGLDPEAVSKHVLDPADEPRRNLGVTLTEDVNTKVECPTCNDKDPDCTYEPQAQLCPLCGERCPGGASAHERIAHLLDGQRILQDIEDKQKMRILELEAELAEAEHQMARWREERKRTEKENSRLKLQLVDMKVSRSIKRDVMHCLEMKNSKLKEAIREALGSQNSIPECLAKLREVLGE